ncbi:MAG: MurR/RpiR family transcriptional regulator, partial [Mycoplasma sp.]|nr:MurR/RpiR family transcriptional regulator [Mycoplasma sp.]
SSIKSFASKHNVSSSLITRLFQKIDLKGYKEAKEILFNPYQNYDLSSINNSNYDIYIKSINQSLLYCINNLDMVKVDQIVNNILESKKIIIFSTGNTKNLSSIFFINLNLFKLNVYLSSSLYETNNHIIDENTTIICISLS